MSYDVDWDAVEDDLARVWMNAPDRDALSASIHRIDKQLERDPGACGESRGPNERLVFQGPAGVLFRIEEPNRVVILSVGLAGRRK
jgi:hypothetical protein